jgi:peptidyl-prolyl cis-trans isomerase D
MSAKVWIDKIKPNFKSTTDVESFVNGNSDPYEDKNYKDGDLPDSLNLMFKESVGAIHGPYFEAGSFKLARLYKIVYVPDSVKARHILIIPKGNAQPDYAKAKSLADSIKKLVEKGEDFTNLAKIYSGDKSNSLKGGDLGWFTDNKMVKPFSDTAFSAKKGAVKLVETNYGIHILQVLERSPEKKKVKVAFIQKKIIPSRPTYDLFLASAIKFASENRTKQQFDAACVKQKLLKQPATNIRENEKNIPGLGSNNIRQVVDWVYNAQKNEVSEPITIGDQYIVATLGEIKEKGTAPLEQVKSEVNLLVRKQKQAEIIAEKINKAKAGTNSIESLALKLNATVEAGNGITFSSYSIGNLGNEPKLVAYIANYPLHKVSTPIQGNNGVYVIEVSNITEAPALKDYSMFKMGLDRNLLERASDESSRALLKLANIEDYRRKFGF